MTTPESDPDGPEAFAGTLMDGLEDDDGTPAGTPTDAESGNQQNVGSKPEPDARWWYRTPEGF